jgi:hypothetical protein
MNADISLQTFLFGIVGIIVGVQNGMSLPFAFFCFTIALMQFIEYIVWTFYDNKTVNYASSIAASSLLWIQPIASILTLPNGVVRNGMLLVYGLLSVFGQFFQRKTDYSMTRAANGHLSWNWMDQSHPQYYFSLIVYLFFLFVPLWMNKLYDVVGLGAVTLAVSLYTYWQYNTWGSMWCWIVNAIVMYILGKTILGK